MLFEMSKLFFLRVQNVKMMVFSLLRYLNDGTFVQIAISGDTYCSSAYKAFDYIVQHASKVNITSGIGYIFTLLGVAAISILIGMCAYFTTLYLPYYQERIESPLVICFMSGVIAFAISCLYLSMIDITSTAVLQCFLLDQENGRGRALHATERITDILETE